MDRRRGRPDPVADTGRMGFRTEYDPVDERPLIYYAEPFWESPEEEALWVRAVRSCPLSEYGKLDLFQYLAEVGQVAVGIGGAVRRMPRPGMGPRKRDARLALLRGQAAGMPSGTEDYS